jgi:hypothetical protein
LLKELKNYRWKTDRNGNKLDQPVKFADHICFVGETLVRTADGVKRIDKITDKDFVLTSDGFRKVNEVYDNGVHLVEKYLMQFDTFEVILICTPNHLIKTNEGWTEISKLQSGMTIYLDNFTKESHLNYNQEKGTLTMEEIRCTGLYGNVSEVLDQKASMCITKTGTHGTTTSTTLNLLKLTSTYQHTSNEEWSRIQNGMQILEKKELRQHQNGTKVKKGLSGIANTQKRLTLGSLNTYKQNAYSVEQNIPKKHIMQNSAIQTAKLKHLGVEGSWKERVYDLNVDEMHEYFANGVLVHNCDALRYGIYSKLTIPSVTWGVI